MNRQNEIHKSSWGNPFPEFNKRGKAINYRDAGTIRESPGAARENAGAVQKKAGVVWESSNAAQDSSGAVQKSGAAQKSLGTVRENAGAVLDRTDDTPVTSVEEYLQRVDQIYKQIQADLVRKGITGFRNILWYRGLATTQYDLKPSISRGDLNADYEIVYLSNFKSLAIPYVQRLPGYPFDEGRPSYWGWLFLMQHYGLPTRLLDWSQDALVALLFASYNRTAAQRENDAVVWLLNPVKLNEAFQLYDFLPPGYVPNVEEEPVYRLFGPDSKALPGNKKPIAVIGPINSTRIMAQKGVFTVYPHDKNLISMDLLPDSNEYLYKITIATDKTDSIVAQLNSFGMTYASLFPDIDKIVDQINEEHLFTFGK